MYVGLGLWRELPAGVDGAYQLLANLVSLGKTAKLQPPTGAQRPAAAGEASRALSPRRSRSSPSGCSPARPTIRPRPARSRSSSSNRPSASSRYQIRPDGDRYALTSTFSFADRGTSVPLNTSLQFRAPLTPTHFTIKGDTARLSTIDQEVTQVPPATFTLAGYAPVSMQMELVRYWMSHGRPASIPLAAAGYGAHRAAGPRHDFRRRTDVDARSLQRERRSCGDARRCGPTRRASSQALVSVDAEFDHFEAVRPELEDAVPQLVARAASDGMAAMAETAAAVLPPPRLSIAITRRRRSSTSAGSDRPLADSTVVVTDGASPLSVRPVACRFPQGATIVDAAGKTSFPGSWDMHAHFEQVEWGPIYLASGMTTVRDVGNELEFITSVRDAIASGKGIGPRMLLAGIVDGDGPNAMGAIRATTAGGGARRWCGGITTPDSRRSRSTARSRLPVLRAITAEAHVSGMTVTGHVPTASTRFQAIDAGMDQINHAEYIANVA